MGKKIRLTFIDRDDTAIVKWIKDWENVLGPQYKKLITELNDNIIDFKDTCPDLALNIKMDYWNENKEYTN